MSNPNDEVRRSIALGIAAWKTQAGGKIDGSESDLTTDIAAEVDKLLTAARANAAEHFRAAEELASNVMRLKDEGRAHRRWAAYWLLRCMEAFRRQGWEEGPSTEETIASLVSVLASIGVDVGTSEEQRQRAAEVLATPEPHYPPATAIRVEIDGSEVPRPQAKDIDL